MSFSHRILLGIRKYFSDNDFQFLGEDGPDELVFSNDKNETLLVKILFEDEASLEALTRALTSVVKKSSKYNMVYIAVPVEMYGRGIETSLHENGVGLIVYNDVTYKVDEKIPAETRRLKAAKSTRLPKTSLSERSLLRIESSLKELSERVDSLEKAYLSLLREVREIRRLMERRMIAEERPAPQPVRLETPEEPGELPSFLKDNPWVEILSKRSEGI
ncbi:MAG: hypothetical protein ACUVQ0_04270 [Thermoproteota archaeon]